MLMLLVTGPYFENCSSRLLGGQKPWYPQLAQGRHSYGVVIITRLNILVTPVFALLCLQISRRSLAEIYGKKRLHSFPLFHVSTSCHKYPFLFKSCFTVCKKLSHTLLCSKMKYILISEHKAETHKIVYLKWGEGKGRWGRTPAFFCLHSQL